MLFLVPFLGLPFLLSFLLRFFALLLVGAADGVGAIVVGASVVGASVVGSSVVGARVVGASVVGASVVGASVVGASVVGASVVGASVVGSRVVGASVGGVVGAFVGGGPAMGHNSVLGVPRPLCVCKQHQSKHQTHILLESVTILLASIVTVTTSEKYLQILSNQ